MNTKTQDQVQQLLNDFNSKTIPADGLLYATELYALPLNYSLASLKPLDSFLKELHIKGETPNTILGKKGGLNFITLFAVYLGEVISRQTGKKVEWYNYYEAVNILPKDFGLPQEFFTSIVAMIQGNVCLPLGVLADILHGENNGTCESYVQERCQVAGEKHSNDPNEWCKIYLEAFRNKKYMPGGNAYRSALELIAFDDSLRSVEEIDRLLLTIKKTEQLGANDYAAFIKNPEKMNALLLIGFYLGTLVAKHTREVIKWFSFDEFKQLTNQPDLERRFEMHAMYRITDFYQKPLEVITAILFDPNYDPNDGGPSCLDYVKRMIARLPQGNLTYYPSNSTPTYSEQPISEPLKLALKDAGFLAAMATFHVQDGGSYQPTKLNRHGDKSTLFSLMGENAIDMGMQDLEHNHENLPYQSFAYDIYANLPTGRIDAFAIEVRGYGSDAFKLSLIVPYQKKDKDHEFQIHSIVTNMVTPPFPPSKMQAVIEAFYEGAFGFVSPFTQKSLWNECFNDLTIPALDNQPATAEFLDEQEQRFIEALAQVRSNTSQETTQTAANETSQEENNAAYREMLTNLNVAELVEQLPLNYRSYLQVVPPSWMKGDELYSQITAMPTLYRTGKVVWAALIQANSLMFQPEGASCPGEIIFDPTGQTDLTTLLKSARQLFALKDTRPEQADQLKYAKHLTNERTRMVNSPFPQSIAPLPLRMSSVWFWRMHLPDGMLTLSYFPVIISEQCAGEAIVLPALFWPKIFKDMWKAESLEKNNGKMIDLEASVIKRLDEGRQDLPESKLEPRLPLIFSKNIARTKTNATAGNTNKNQAEVLFEQAKQILDDESISMDEKKKAVDPLVEAARLGSTDAMTQLAYFYGEGVFVEKNEKTARDYLLKLAHRGDINSCVGVAHFYLAGKGGEANPHEARHWLNIAAQKGHADATDMLRDLDRMIARSEMAALAAEVTEPINWMQWGIIAAVVILLLGIIF